MRKITSLLMLLCVFVGTAWAQTSITDVAKLSNSKLYYLKSERGSLVYNEANPNILCSTAAYSSIGAESDAAKWAVYKYKNNYYFYTYAGEKFVGKSTGQFPLNVNSADPVSIYESGSTKGYPFAFSFNGTGTIDQYNHDAAPGVAYWSNGMNNKNDGGTAHMIIEAGDMPDGLEALIKSKLTYGD